MVEVESSSKCTTAAKTDRTPTCRRPAERHPTGRLPDRQDGPPDRRPTARSTGRPPAVRRPTVGRPSADRPADRRHSSLALYGCCTGLSLTRVLNWRRFPALVHHTGSLRRYRSCILLVLVRVGVILAQRWCWYCTGTAVTTSRVLLWHPPLIVSTSCTSTVSGTAPFDRSSDYRASERPATRPTDRQTNRLGAGDGPRWPGCRRSSPPETSRDLPATWAVSIMVQ